MNSDRDFETTAAEWLNAGSDTTPPHVIDAVLLAARSTPQERDLRIPLRTPTMNKFVTFGFGATAVVVVLLVAAQLFGWPGNVGSIGEPTPTPGTTASESSSSPSVASRPLPPQECAELEAGTYRAAIGAVSVTVSVPTGWNGSSGLGHFNVNRRGTLPEGGCLWAGGVALNVSLVRHVYSSTCDGQDTAVEAGTPAAVTAALAAQTGHETSGPSDTTIAGYPASRFEFSLPGGAEACNGGPLWRTPGGGEGPGMAWDERVGSFVTVYVVDVDGLALGIAVDSGVPGYAADVAELDAIVDSLRIESGEEPTGVEEFLSAGSYSLSELAPGVWQFPVGITFEIPAVEPPVEWFACSFSPAEQGVCHESAGDLVGVGFQIVDNVVADPCSDQQSAKLLDPPVGPSVDDLVTAISNLEGFEATAPEDVTVSGFSGKEFTLTAPDTEGCGATWATAERTTGMGPNEINLLRILDVDGVRVVISGAYHPETPDTAVAAVEQVMDSVQIQP